VVIELSPTISGGRQELAEVRIQSWERRIGGFAATTWFHTNSAANSVAVCREREHIHHVTGCRDPQYDVREP
jgi:hypothetical protein